METIEKAKIETVTRREVLPKLFVGLATGFLSPLIGFANGERAVGSRRFANGERDGKILLNRICVAGFQSLTQELFQKMKLRHHTTYLTLDKILRFLFSKPPISVADVTPYFTEQFGKNQSPQSLRK